MSEKNHRPQLHEQVSGVARYSEAMDGINTGDLLAWRITKVNTFFELVLFLYQKFFKASYAHVAVAVRIGDMVFAVEAVPPVSRLIPLSSLDDFYLYPTKVPTRRSNIQVLLKRLGKPYSLVDFAKGLAQIAPDDNNLYCVEQTHNFYQDIGFFNSAVEKDGERTSTPDDMVRKVLRECNSQPVFVRIDRGNLHAT